MYRLAPFALLYACATTPPADPPAPTPPAPISYDDCLAPDCPYVGVNLYPMYDDEVTNHIIPLAVNGEYDFGWELFASEPGTTTVAVSGGFTMIQDVPQHTRVRGAIAGIGTLTVTGHVPYHDTEVYAATPEDLEILPVDDVRFDLPRYVPFDKPIAAVVAARDVKFTVRLLASGREVADETLVENTGEPVTWNSFVLGGLALGHHDTKVTADSLAVPTTVGFDVIDAEDSVRTTDVHESGNTFYHLVCAHAFVGEAEVYTTWTMSAENATGWIPATDGNCLEVVPTANTTVTFTAADAKSVAIVVTP